MNYTRETYQRTVSEFKFASHEGEIARQTNEEWRCSPEPLATRAFPWVETLTTITQQAYVAGIVEDVIVHGSCGDQTTTPFSDLDLTILLQSRALEQDFYRKRLRVWLSRKMHPLLLRVDPLQHHGAFFLWPHLCENYNQSILPFSAYTGSWSIRNIELRFQCAQGANIKQSRKAFRRTIEALLDDRHHFFSLGTHPYSIKRYLANFFLLSAFYYQAQGHCLSKVDSIHRIQDEDHPTIATAIVAASELRETWTPTPNWLGRLRAATCLRRIPGGITDRILCACYRNKDLESRFLHDVRPKIHEACRHYLTLDNDENN